MDKEEFRLMMSAVKQHYELGVSQEEIARKEYVSKSKVCRLLKKAVELGYVEYKINYVGESVEMLQQKFLDVFNTDCSILPCFVDDYLVRLNDVCSYAAKDLAKIINNNDIIGVTWGQTTEYLAKNLVAPVKEKSDVQISMLSGFVNGSIVSMKATHIIEKFSEIYSAQGFILPAPLLVDSKENAQVILSDSNIRNVIDLCKSAQTVILSIGSNDIKKSLLTNLGPYWQEIYDQIKDSGVAGDIAGRYFDIQGNEIESSISNRLISLSIKELKAKSTRIGIAVGEHKSRSILGALRGKIINKLYTDERTAKQVLDELGKTGLSK